MGAIVRCLTVYSPWAQLIAIGAKPYEFRGHRPPKAYIGQRIAIHAGKRPVALKEVAELLAVLRSSEAWMTCLKSDLAIPLLESVMAAPKLLLAPSVVLCTAILGEPRSGYDIAAEFGGKINDSDRDEHANFGWPLTEIELVIPPQEHRGMQGWSEWTP